MKKSLCTLVLFLIGAFCVNAQTRQITVQNGNNASFYTNLDSAIVNAPAGSSIYIPDGEFTHNRDILINKKLNIYGVGHYPNTNNNLLSTKIVGDFYLISGADSSKISGIYFHGNGVYLGHNNFLTTVNFVTITRCRIHSIDCLIEYCYNNCFMENVIVGGINGRKCFNTLIKSNIFSGSIVYNIGNNSIIENNIFLGNAGNNNTLLINNISNSIIRNNIFSGTSANLVVDPYDNDNGIHYSTFENNLFRGNVTNFGATNNNISNIVNVAYELLFINQDGGSNFNYTHDYHLKANSPGKNAGSDGTDIGIYGSQNPYKENAVPAIPKVYGLTVGTQGNTIQFNVSAEAQQR